MSNFFTPEFNNESAIAPWNATLEPTKAIIPQLDANRVLTGGVSQEVNIPTLTPQAYDNIILPDDLLTRMASAVSTDSNSSLPDSSVDLLTGQAMSEVYGDLSKFAAGPDFVAKMNLAFGENWDAAGAKALAEGWFNGDFSDIPPVKVVSSAEIDGANGAFAAATDTIYLSKEFLAGNVANPAVVADVLREEIGHSVDARLNVTDSQGDEGAIFGAIVQGKELSQGELQGLKSKDDTANVVLGGENTTIEMSQQGWVLGSYIDWRNQNFDFQKPDQINPIGNRRDGKDGIYVNWGKGSPFDPANTDIVNELNYFATSGYTQANFEAGKTYKFRVSADDYIVMGAKQIGQSGFNWITPLNQDRTEPEWQRFSGGIFKDYTWTPAQSGSYKVQFWHYDITGDAGVDISWEAQSPTVKNNTITVENKTFPVELSLYKPFGDVGKAERSNIDPNKDTVVVIHGRGSGGIDTDITGLAEAAAASNYYPNSQVLYLDWKEAANVPIRWESDFGPYGALKVIPYEAASRIRPVANWAVEKLKELGIDPQKTILLGHSLGSYVASEIGRIGGKVKELVALDPAYPASKYDIDGNNPGLDTPVDFRDVATKSIALVASDREAGGAAGDNEKASSANDSYIVDFTGYPAWRSTFQYQISDYHKAIVGVYSDILSSASRSFNEPLIFPDKYFTFQNDRYDNNGIGYENSKFPRHDGLITVDLTNIVDPRIQNLRYVDSNNIEQTTWNWLLS
ncbi:hypothetical protein [Microcoleus sp. D3_18a_C4]|uniref:hypothetical protein n=1 Tax=unclassified Microcoleus TaxID=2642155 RepID=UPI002FD719C8